MFVCTYVFVTCKWHENVNVNMSRRFPWLLAILATTIAGALRFGSLPHARDDDGRVRYDIWVLTIPQLCMSIVCEQLRGHSVMN